MSWWWPVIEINPWKCKMERSPALACGTEPQTQFSVQINRHFWRLYVNRSLPISLDIQSIFKVIKYWTWSNKYNQVNQDLDWWLQVHKKACEESFCFGFVLLLHFSPFLLSECRNCGICTCRHFEVCCCICRGAALLSLSNLCIGQDCY